MEEITAFRQGNKPDKSNYCQDDQGCQVETIFDGEIIDGGVRRIEGDEEEMRRRGE